MMSSSPKRVIKLKRPISEVVVVPAGRTGQKASVGQIRILNAQQQSDMGKETTPGDDEIKLTKTAMQQERDAAYENGLREGEARGFENATAQLQHASQTLTNLIASINENQQQTIKQSETFCLSLIFSMVEKIVSTMSEQQKELVQVVLMRVLKEAEVAGRVKILVNPRDLASIQEMEGELRHHIPDLKELGVSADESVAAGGCIIDTDMGKLDASINTQLKEMTDKLHKLYQELEVETEFSAPPQQTAETPQEQ